MSRASFAGLVTTKNVRRIEIPMIQRDYAQGRDGARVMRDAFLDVVRDAATGVRTVHLDFVYGVDGLVEARGTERAGCAA